MYSKLLLAIGSAAALALVACDKDPSEPRIDFGLAGCPTGDLAPNSPIPLNFTSPVSPSSVSGANVVVTDATTGIEVPGSLSLAQGGTQVLFTPSSALPFGTILAIRLQNLISSTGTVPLGVVVCNVKTQAPPIAEVVWDQLESPTGTQLVGASMFAADSGWVASSEVPLYKRVPGGWDVRFTQPYFALSRDVSFATARHGFGTHFNDRLLRSYITETRDGGLVFDTLFSVGGRLITRLVFDSLNSNNTLFGVIGGGNAVRASFSKYTPSTGAITEVSSFTKTSQVGDIDYPRNDTTRLAANSRGTRFINNTVNPGRVYISSDGGASWVEVPGTAADTERVVDYRGVARRKNGDIFVVGGNGYVARIPATGLTTFGAVQQINLGIVTLDSADFNALSYTDVEFAPDDDNYGWIVGRRLTGFTAGVPRFQGLIFETRDGGATWIRQGVRNAPDYGASFPALNRLDVFSHTSAWAVGDGGTVLSVKH